MSKWANTYVVIHITVALFGVDRMGKLSGVSQMPAFAMVLFFIWSMTSLGLLLDKSVWGWVSEALRSSLCLVMLKMFASLENFVFAETALRGIFIASFIVALTSTAAHVYLIYAEGEGITYAMNGKKRKTK